MRKLISFCLHGGKDKYCRGFYENLPLANEFYPEWEVILFHDNTVPAAWLDKYKEAGVEVHNVDHCGLHPTAYRFLACNLTEIKGMSKIERVIFRDADSRLSQREAEAVKEWEDGGMGLHGMRDHPHHNNANYPIFAGMFGLVLSELGDFDVLQHLLAYQGGPKRWNLSRNRRQDWGIDQHFLRDTIYQKFFNDKSILIHTVCEKRFDFEVDFPSPRNKDKNFVGEIFDFVNGRENRAPQWKHL